MDEKGNRRVEIAGLQDKRQITAVFCGSIQGDFFPVLTKEQHNVAILVLNFLQDGM